MNIKPRFLQKVKRFTNIFSRFAFVFTLIAYLSGYYPVFDFPPVRQTVASAQVNQLSHEVEAGALPKPPKLPHPGYLSTRFSSYHPGIDIATGLGMPIKPITDGIVELVSFGFWGYGNHVIIAHAGGFKSMYAHMGRVYVRTGQEVSENATIGEVGMTGRTSGPHTHLEITKNGTPIDPLTILPEIADFPSSNEQGSSANEQSSSLNKPVGGNDATIRTNSSLHKTLKPDFN